MMIPLAVLVLTIFQPAVGASDQPAMLSEIARSRIVLCLDNEVDINERLEMLEEVIVRCEDSQLVSGAHLNLGILKLELGETDPEYFQQAVDHFRASDRLTHDRVLQISARFRIGHAYYDHADGAQESPNLGAPFDPEELLGTMRTRVETLRSSAAAFRSVIDIDSSQARASMNVERVRREIQSLLDQIQSLEEMIEQQQEQQKQQQKEQQDAADALNELAKEQQDQADQTASSPPQNDDEQDQQQSEQQDLSDSTEQQRQEIEQQDNDGTDEVDQKMQEAQEAQKRAQEAMQQGDQEKAAQEQGTAAELLKEAAEAMQRLADESEEQQGDPENPNGGDQTKEPESNDADSEEGDELDEMTQSLLDKERREREKRQVYRAKGRPVQVEKDW